MGEPDDPSVRNSMSGSVTGNSVQIGAVHGNVIWRSRGVVVLTVAALVAALGIGVGVAWLNISSGSSASGSPADSAADPVSVAIELQTDMCMVPWAVARPPAEVNLTAPMGSGSTYSWTAWEPTRNGTSATPANVWLTVQGRSEAQVVLTGLRVRVSERRTPPSGTAVKGVCGDRGALRWLRVDLDTEPPRIQPVVSEGAQLLPGEAEWERQPIRFPYKVSLSDAETFLIEANTQNCACAWTGELSWASQGRSGTMRIDDHGQPFVTTSTKAMTWCSVYTTPDMPPSCEH